MIMSDNWLVKQQHEDIKLLSAENKRLEAKVKRMEIELQDLQEMLKGVRYYGVREHGLFTR
jgi:cell division protein FtsB